MANFDVLKESIGYFDINIGFLSLSSHLCKTALPLWNFSLFFCSCTHKLKQTVFYVGFEPEKDIQG